jgi:hypothetical protein
MKSPFTLPQRREIKKLALSRPVDRGLPFSTWSLAKLAEVLVAEGVVDDISHEGLRLLLREEGVSFQRLKTWKPSNDPAFELKKNRILHLYGLMDGTYGLMDGTVDVLDGDPDVVICLDEFGPLNLHPTRVASGRPMVAVGYGLAVGGGPPTPVPMAYGTCWPPMT